MPLARGRGHESVKSQAVNLRPSGGGATYTNTFVCSTCSISLALIEFSCERLSRIAP